MSIHEHEHTHTHTLEHAHEHDEYEHTQTYERISNHSIIVFESYNDNSRSFAIDSFPHMEEAAEEEFMREFIATEQQKRRQFFEENGEVMVEDREIDEQNGNT